MQMVKNIDLFVTSGAPPGSFLDLLVLVRCIESGYIV